MLQVEVATPLASYTGSSLTCKGGRTSDYCISLPLKEHEVVTKVLMNYAKLARTTSDTGLCFTSMPSPCCLRWFGLMRAFTGLLSLSGTARPDIGCGALLVRALV